MNKFLIIMAVVLIATASQVLAAVGWPVTAFITNISGCAMVSTTKYIKSGGAFAGNITTSDYSKFGITNVIANAPLAGRFRGILGWTEDSRLVAVDPLKKLRLVDRQDLLWVEPPNDTINGSISGVGDAVDVIGVITTTTTVRAALTSVGTSTNFTVVPAISTVTTNGAGLFTGYTLINVTNYVLANAYSFINVTNYTIAWTTYKATNATAATLTRTYNVNFKYASVDHPVGGAILVSNITASKMVALKAKYGLDNTHCIGFAGIGKNISKDAIEIIGIDTNAATSKGPVFIDSRDVWFINGVD